MSNRTSMDGLLSNKPPYFLLIKINSAQGMSYLIKQCTNMN